MRTRLLSARLNHTLAVRCRCPCARRSTARRPAQRPTDRARRRRYRRPFRGRRIPLPTSLGVQLEADVGLARLHAVPLAVAHHAAARQHAPVHLPIVRHHRPPADRERRRRAPIHRAKPHPVFRDLERRDHMPLGVPTVEERAERDRPITIQPRLHQFLAAGRSQPLLVGLDVNERVVVRPSTG